MPVLVTGAEAGLGREAVRALARAGGELRAWLDPDALDDPEGDAARLRAAGVKAAIGTIDDEGRLEQALTRVHTVVHCWGGPIVAPDQELDGLAGVLSAALGAGCRRFVWPSHLGADDPGGDAYLSACAEGEDLLAGAGLESIVIRRALTYGPGDALTRQLAGPAGDGVRPTPATRRCWPRTSRPRSRAPTPWTAPPTRTDLALVLELAGPQVVTAADLVGRPAPGPSRPIHPAAADGGGGALRPRPGAGPADPRAGRAPPWPPASHASRRGDMTPTVSPPDAARPPAGRRVTR